MPNNSLSTPDMEQPKLETHSIRDAGRQRSLRGYFLGEASSKSRYGTHWTELRLYRTEDNRYVLSVIGCSIIYHEHRSSCGRGVATMIASLDDDRYDELEPCRRCNPPDLDDIPEERMVDVEQERYTVHICSTAAELIDQLRDPKSPSGAIGGPGQQLLGSAVKVDPELNRAMSVVEPI